MRRDGKEVGGEDGDVEQSYRRDVSRQPRTFISEDAILHALSHSSFIKRYKHMNGMSEPAASTSQPCTPWTPACP